MRAMRTLAIMMIIALACCLTACEKTPEQALDDLGADDAGVRARAIETLARDGKDFTAQLTSALSSNNPQELEATFEVLRRLGESAMPEMLAKIGYVWRSKDVLNGFREYFESLGDKGYEALLAEFQRLGEAVGNEATADGSMVKMEGLYHQFESVSLVAETMQSRKDVGNVPALLHNPYSRVRARAAYVLCLKGWYPKDKVDHVIFLSHLAATLECSQIPEPVDDAARLAAEDLALFLETDKKYPPPSNATYQILAAAGTEEVARHVYQEARKSKNEFLVFNLFGVLKKMNNEIGHQYARKLLADPKLGRSIRSIDPQAVEDL